MPKLAQYLPQESLIPVKYGSQGNINQPVIRTNKIIGLDDLSKGRQGSQEYITISQFVSARLEVLEYPIRLLLPLFIKTDSTPSFLIPYVCLSLRRDIHGPIKFSRIPEKRS